MRVYQNVGFGTPSAFMPTENPITMRRLIFGDIPKISDSQGAKFDKIVKTGLIGVYFPLFWPVLLFLNTFSLD